MQPFRGVGPKSRVGVRFAGSPFFGGLGLPDDQQADDPTAIDQQPAPESLDTTDIATQIRNLSGGLDVSWDGQQPNQPAPLPAVDDSSLTTRGQLAQAMMQRGLAGTPTTKWGALARVGSALGGAYLSNQVDEETLAAKTAKRKQLIDALTNANVSPEIRSLVETGVVDPAQAGTALLTQATRKPDKPSAPVMRTVMQGTNAVQQQYDPDTKEWSQVGQGPRFAPPKPEDQIEGRLPPETLRFMAGQGLAGDKSIFLNLGRGKQGAQNVVGLRNEMVRQASLPQWGPKGDRPMTPQEMAARMGEFSGFVAGQQTIGRRAANADMAVNEALRMAKIARTASSEVPRGSFVPANEALNYFNTQTGDPKIRRFGAAINSFVNIYARAINPQGIGTDADKTHAREMLTAADSPEAFEGVMDILEQEMGAAKASTAATRTELSDIIGGRDRPSDVRQEDGGPGKPAGAIAAPAAGPKEGDKAVSKSGKPIVFHNGQWGVMTP